jgi:hypothetical protein
MIEMKTQKSGGMILDDLRTGITMPANGAPVPSAGFNCTGTATPGQAVTVTLYNPTTGATAVSVIAAGGYAGSNWNTLMPPVDPAFFPGVSLLMAQVNPPDGPISSINVTVVP